MSKSLVLGNGNLLVSLDGRGQVCDFYFPRVGLENQSGGFVHRIGIFVDGSFSWFSGSEWEVIVDYKTETMVSNIEARSSRHEISVFFNDIVYNESNIFLRKIVVHNKSSRAREIKIYFHQEFQISQSHYGNTAYYEPKDSAIVHYKRRRLFFVSGESTKGDSFNDYTVGLSHIEGKEGTWKDAEDGALSKNGIEHGSVDSTVGFYLKIPADGVKELYYWIIASHTLREARKLNNYILKKTPAHLLKSTGDFWKAWVNKRRFVFYGLNGKVSELFKKSLLIMRTHADNHGAIIASGDSSILQHGRDTYSYMWPRDGAFITEAFDKAGYFDLSERFYEFCKEVLTDEGFLLHKYNSDKSLGSSWHPWIKDGVTQYAIQEDETAITLSTLWDHYVLGRDLEFIEHIYNSYIQKAADFLTHYRDPYTKLPSPSYDLWEERRGILCFTSCAVYGGLIAASKFASLLGKQSESKRYRKTASEIQNAIIKFFFNEKEGSFTRLINVGRKGKITYDKTADASSAYGVFRFNVLPSEDERLIRAIEYTRRKLTVPTSIGGIARYERDSYYGVGSSVPGNPWFITTLWLTRFDISRAQNEKELESVKRMLLWVTDKATHAGLLSEQLHPYSGEPISVRPLIWSHGEFILTVIYYLEKLEELGVCKTCYPIPE